MGKVKGKSSITPKWVRPCAHILILRNGLQKCQLHHTVWGLKPIFSLQKWALERNAEVCIMCKPMDCRFEIIIPSFRKMIHHISIGSMIEKIATISKFLKNDFFGQLKIFSVWPSILQWNKQSKMFEKKYWNQNCC